jgi:tripartite-type tricarboxylate transporter receptor subunit TctC
VPSTKAQDVLRAYLKSETDSWGAIIRQAGIVPE